MNPPKLIIPKGWEECKSHDAEIDVCVKVFQRLPDDSQLFEVEKWYSFRRIKRKQTKRRNRVKPRNDIPYADSMEKYGI